MKHKRIVTIAAAIAVAGVLYMVLAGNPGALTFYRTWRQIGSLQQDIVRANKTIDSLNVEIDRLKNDTAHIERIAREKYGMARSNEKLYKFIEEK
jgi:cell division protein FtsB